MLTDLRDRLKGVGRLDAMTSTNARAMAYYGAQPLERLGPDSLERRARILLAMGADNERLGDLATARGNYAEAKRATAALRRADPTNPDRIFADAQSDYWTGHVDELAGNFEAAVVAYGRYRRAARALLALQPNSPRGLTEVAYAENNIGVLELNGFHRPARAVTAFLAATKAFEAALRQSPANADLRFETANAYAWLADAVLATGDAAMARQHRLTDRAIKAALLAADPRNRRYAYAIIVTDRALASIDIGTGEQQRAATTLATAAADIAALEALDPANMMWREQAARIAIDRARLWQSTGDTPRAMALLRATRARVAGNGGDVPAEKGRRDMIDEIDSMLAPPATPGPDPKPPVIPITTGMQR
jgi:tetratricopeptide (TPR) repeat protein